MLLNDDVHTSTLKPLLLKLMTAYNESYKCYKMEDNEWLLLPKTKLAPSAACKGTKLSLWLFLQLSASTSFDHSTQVFQQHGNR